MSRQNITLNNKRKIIECLERNQSVTKIARDYGIAKSTVCSIHKNKLKILNAINESSNAKLQKKTLKSAELPIMEKELYKWICDERSQQSNLTGDMIKTKAKELHLILQPNKSFKASDGWLQRFKKRFGLNGIKINHDKYLDPFKHEILKIIKEKNMSKEQLYIANESQLLWKLLRDESKITFLACTNIVGTHKIKPLIIGKSKSAIDYENIKLPIEYQYSKDSTISTDIFKQWFNYYFIPQVVEFSEINNLPKGAILLLLEDTPFCPPKYELKSDDGNITIFVKFTNVEIFKQTIDHFIHLTKLHYLNNIFSNIIKEPNQSVYTTLKSLTLNEAIINLVSAWDKLQPKTIHKCWKNKLEHENSEEEKNIYKLLKEKYISKEFEESIKEAISLFNNIKTKSKCSLDELQGFNGCDDIKEEKCNFIINKVSSSEAFDAINKVIDYGETNMFPVDDLLVLQRCKEVIASQMNG